MFYPTKQEKISTRKKLNEPKVSSASDRAGEFCGVSTFFAPIVE